jgi:hypothetical protein
MMKKIILLIAVLASTALFAYGSSYVSMTKTGSKSINFQWSECYYKSMFNQGFGTIVITIKGSTFSCPYNIKYYPQSGTWSK